MNKQRTNSLAAIHAAKRDLAMDDATYRAMLVNETGKSSAKYMTPAELNKVLDRLRKAGAKLKPRKRVAQYPGRPHNCDDNAMLGKIEALLSELKAPWSYADAIAKNQTGITKLTWVSKQADLQGIIAALAVELEKRQLLSKVNELLEQQGSTAEVLEQTLQLKKGWQRNRRTLKGLIQKLSIREEV